MTVVRPVTGFPITQVWGQLEGQSWGSRNANGANGHPGVDYGCPNGTPVRAVTDGEVIYAGPASGFGDHLVSIWHPQYGLTSRYGHMQAHLVNRGDTVTAGQQIGVSNNEGESTGPHLHFELGAGQFIDAGNPPNIDPEAWLVANLGGAVAPKPDVTTQPEEDDEVAGVLPTITGADHTHPKTLALLKVLIKQANPAADVSTDAKTLQAVEQIRAFFKVTGDPAGRVGRNMWRALLSGASGGGK